MLVAFKGINLDERNKTYKISVDSKMKVDECQQ